MDILLVHTLPPTQILNTVLAGVKVNICEIVFVIEYGILLQEVRCKKEKSSFASLCMLLSFEILTDDWFSEKTSFLILKVDPESVCVST